MLWYFGGVPVAHLISFLCCGILVGSLLLILLVFCVVVFGGVPVAHLISFLCCVSSSCVLCARKKVSPAIR